MNRFLLFVFTCIFSLLSISQQIKIGDWAMHLNYTNVTAAVKANNKIYVGTRSGLFIYNTVENSVTPFSKIDGLSDLDVSALAYDNGVLIVGYTNGNLDILSGSIISSIPYISLANIIGSKKINNIFIDQNNAYLSCPFGIVVIDIVKLEVAETYYLSNDGTNTEVFSLHIFDENTYTEADMFLANKIFVGTNKGLFYADKNDNLLNFNSWQKDSKVSLSEGSTNTYDLNNTVVPLVLGLDKKENGGKQLIIEANLDYTKIPPPWSGEEQYYLFQLNTTEYTNPYSNKLNLFDLNLGVPGDIVHLDHDKISQHTLVVSIDNNTEKIIILNDLMQNILSVNSKNINNTDQNLSIIFGLLAENYNMSKKIFLGDERHGIISANKNDFSIDLVEFIAPNGPAGINTGAIFANNNNLLLTHGAKNGQWNNLYNYQEISLFNNNYWSQSNQLINQGIFDAIAACGNNDNTFFVGTWNSGLLEFLGDSLIKRYTTENTYGALESITGTSDWIRIGGVDFDENGVLWMTNSQTEKPLIKLHQDNWTSFIVPNLPTNNMSGKLLCTSNGQKWIQLRDNGVVVARELKNIIDSKKLDTSNGLAGNTVNCFAEDNNGEVWVGTSQGLSIFYFPNEIFNTNNYSAQYILIETDDGYVERLFENTEILDIKVDGGNRKWIGTKMNGVFLISDDGTTQIYNFTKENSPLISNTVYDIDIIPSSGEVFFLTSGGLCSYRSNATVSSNDFNKVSVFPNPVRPNYSGKIAISGLNDQTNVKITTVSGDLVFETISNGGTATWDGRNFDGIKVSTGIYLFLCVSSDFENSIVKKVMIYN